MSGAILQAANRLASGLTTNGGPLSLITDTMLGSAVAYDNLDYALGVFSGDELPDIPRLAALVAGGSMEGAVAENLLFRDLDAAISETEIALRPPCDGDRATIGRHLVRLQVLREQRERAWQKAAADADYTLDAVVDRIAAGPDVPLSRPTVTHAEAAAVVEAVVDAAVAGNGPRHALLNAPTGTYKTSATLRAVGREAAKRRDTRRRWIEDFRRDNPGTTLSDATRAADRDGPRPFRVRYVGDTIRQVGDAVAQARTLGLTAEHHAGYDRGLDPTDDDAPAVCSQPVRRGLTQQAGDSVRSLACSGCPDFDGCARLQRLARLPHVEFVGMTSDFAFMPVLPRELTQDFDLTILDEAVDRTGYGKARVPLDHLSARFFDKHPVRDADGAPDTALTAMNRAEFAKLRDLFDKAPNDYAPMDELRAAGFDRDHLLHLVDMTDARLTPSGITTASTNDQRRDLAARSFRQPLSSVCGLLRQLAEPGDGWVRLDDGKEGRIAVVHSVRKLHPSILNGRILVLEADPIVGSWQRFIPDLEVVNAPRPHAPHETAVQIVRPMGKRAMRDPARKAGAPALVNPRKVYAQALVRLYGHGSTGVLTHKEHEEAFAGPGITPGHFNAVAGSNAWKDVGTFFTFGLPSLSPEDAAYGGAGRTGEAVPIEMPRRALVPALMKSGGVTLVPSMEFARRAAREAQAAVRERQAIQGPGGRPRGANRTAANPVLNIYVGTTPVPGLALDAIVTSASELAPDRFLTMAADGLVVASGLDRHRVHPTIYPKRHTADYDTPREVGGMIETLQRVLYPAWWGNRPRETWLVLRYWVGGRGNRQAGRVAACPVGEVMYAKNRLREACGAVRFEIVAEVERPAPEVTRMRVDDDYTWILGTSPRVMPNPLFPCLDTPPTAEHPPDG